MNAEEKRLEEARSRKAHWKRWGPYVSDRAWGTVREDYSATGEAWEYFPHDHARSRAYRWNEDGLVPAICKGAGVIMRKIFPRFTGRTIVLAHCSPGAIADVRAPSLPMRFARTCFFESLFFGIHSCSPRFDCFRAINFWSRAPSSLVCLRIFSSHSRAGWESSIA